MMTRQMHDNGGENGEETQVRWMKGKKNGKAVEMVAMVNKNLKLTIARHKDTSIKDMVVCVCRR